MIYMVFDMFNEPLQINDRVRFIIENDSYEGVINFISPNGLLRVNALIGEYRRMPNNVIKIKQ